MSQQPRGHSKPGTVASPPSIKHLLTVPPNPVSLPNSPTGKRSAGAKARNTTPFPTALFPAHLIGPVPTGVAVGGHDNHFLKVWDFWSRESRKTSKQQPKDGRSPLGVVSSPETALHPNRPFLRELTQACGAAGRAQGRAVPVTPWCSPRPVPTLKGYALTSCWCWLGRCTRGSWC